MRNSIILNTDSYKVSMFKQYPAGTEYVYSYIESRGGQYDSTVFFGLQAFIQEYLTKPITQEDIDVATSVYAAHGEPFNREGWEHILDEHNGYLPLKIDAVPEGYDIPVGMPLVTVVNTDPACYWLTTWVETALLRAVWYPTTVATTSKRIKNVITQYLEETGTPELISFKLHDFGARGVSSLESAGIGGAAHLVNFQGTDTVSALLWAKKYYDAEMPGFSIPAAEHSTITSWGRENEVEAYRNMLKQFAKPGSLVAVVSDSYNIYEAAEKLWGEELRQQVVDSGATVVIRPDSGDPETVCAQLIEILGRKFGYTKNAKGYNVLNNVRLIQGDGVNINSIRCILANFRAHGWSADNIAFGMGGALLQKVDRDTQKFAMKCSAAYVNGKWVDVSKDPITDPGKRSKAGLVTTIKSNTGNIFDVVDVKALLGEGYEAWHDFMHLVYLDGCLISRIKFEEVRHNASNSR